MAPRKLAIENHVLHREMRNGRGHRGAVLRQPIARQQADVRFLTEREQANAIELPLEEPLRPSEALLRERRGHRLDPIGKGHERIMTHDARAPLPAIGVQARVSHSPAHLPSRFRDNLDYR